MYRNILYVIQDYNSSLASRKSIHKAIIGAGKSLQYYPHSPRMVPACCKPKCHKMFLTIPEQSTSESRVKKSKPNEKKTTSVSVATMLKKSEFNLICVVFLLGQ